MTSWRPVVLAILLVPSVAHADPEEGGWFVNAGGSFAYVFHADSDNGGAAGIEISAGQIRYGSDEDNDANDEGEGFNLKLDLAPIWIGGYADILRDPSIDKTRISIGPEVGKSILGIDAGLLVQTGDEPRYGVSV